MKRFCLFISAIILTLYITAISYADTTYVIKQGDTPAKIAKKFGVKSSAIVKLNNLNARNLKTGTKISIPSTKKEGPSVKNKLSKKKDAKTCSKNVKKEAKTEKHQDNSTFYKVKSGDTLLSISKKYSIPVSELKGMNSLSSVKLTKGQKLIVRKTGPKTYTVKKGDNIFRIAKKFDIDADELKNINSLETDVVQPGQKILLEHDIEQEEPKTYDTVISQAHVENEMTDITALEGMSMNEKLIAFAKKLLNIPYRFGGNSLLGIDCSGYVKKVYSTIGVNLPRSAREQYSEGDPVDKDELSVGDLVFFRTYASFPSHVGIYLGNNLFIHASSKSRKVTIDSLETPYYFKRFIGAKRVLDAKNEEGSLKEG